jgi:ATP-binding cassette subfamily B protein
MMQQRLAAPPRRWLAPEVIQSSDMDCGPAALKCLLDGFGIPVSYGRLREACQTDVDGTSIDELERVALQLGLAAEQIIIPADHLLLEEARTLPALLVVQIGNGIPHFVVCWRNHRALVQIMDPATGRRWATPQQLSEELYQHIAHEPAENWRAWAGTPSFLKPLERRLANLGVARQTCAQLIGTAQADPEWGGLAALDAATRMVATLVRSGGVRRGKEAGRTLVRFYQRAHADPVAATAVIPDSYWAVRPLPPEPGEELLLEMRVAVLVRVRGRGTPADFDEEEHATYDYVSPPPLSPELTAAVQQPTAPPEQTLLRLFQANGLATPAVLLGALLLAAGGLVVEVLLLRTLLDVGSALGLTTARLGLTGAILLLLLLLLLLELCINLGLLWMGRHLEARLRVAFLEKLPRLEERYFQSRLTSDMAERSHSMHRIRLLPLLGGQALQTSFTILFTVGGIIWLNPAGAPLALLAGMLAIGLPLVSRRILNEQDLRVRTHVGALSRFIFDGLLGLVTIRTHSAERAMRREHERLLVEWVRASRTFLGNLVLLEGLQLLLGFGLAAALLMTQLNRTAALDEILLLAYWALSLPLLGQELIVLARQYPTYRNITLRLLEPLNALEQADGPAEDIPSDAPPDACGVTIDCAGVDVRAAGHTILHGIDLTLPAGTHTAIVGSSGAGKSSLVGLLLGLHRPAAGEFLIDGRPLDNARLAWLRRHTVWVDPAVQLWNRSLLDNLTYGTPPEDVPPVGMALTAADLRQVLESMPDGLQTRLGEHGRLISGGEGQRVRFGRALLRPDARLVILDEAFRGLDWEQRSNLLRQARQVWRSATLLCVLHDISATQDFDRVLVLEGGQIIEAGDPAALAGCPDSRYSALLAQAAETRARLRSDADWQHIRMEQGQIRQNTHQSTPTVQTDAITTDADMAARSGR